MGGAVPRKGRRGNERRRRTSWAGVAPRYRGVAGMNASGGPPEALRFPGRGAAGTIVADGPPVAERTPDGVPRDERRWRTAGGMAVPRTGNRGNECPPADHR